MCNIHTINTPSLLVDMKKYSLVNETDHLYYYQHSYTVRVKYFTSTAVRYLVAIWTN